MSTKLINYQVKLNGSVTSGFKTVESSFNKIDNNVKKINNTKVAPKVANSSFTSFNNFLGLIKQVGLVMGATFVASKITQFASESVKLFNIQEQAVAQVKQGLISTGNQAGFTLQQLQDQASELQSKTLFGDEAILKGATAQLLTFTNIAGEQFSRTQQAALDLATRLDGDLKSASIQLGKALNDPVANLSALSRSGIQFSDSQKEVINSLVESGRLAEAQTLILNELDKQYGGSAEAAAKAGTGIKTQLSNSFGDLQEKIGGVLLSLEMKFIPILQKTITKLSNFVDWVIENKELFKALGAGIAVAAGAIAAYNIAMGIAWTVTNGVAIAQAALNAVMAMNPVFAVVAGIAALTAGIVYLWNTSEKFRAFLYGLWESIKTVFSNIWKAGKQYLGGLGELLVGIFTLDVSKIKSGLSNAFNGVKDLYTKTGEGVADSFNKGWDKGLKSFAKSKENKPESEGAEDVVVKPVNPTNDLKNQITENQNNATKGATSDVKNISLNLDALMKVGTQNINNKGDLSDIEVLFQQLLMRLANDINGI